MNTKVQLTHSPRPWRLGQPIETDRGTVYGINAHCDIGIRGDARIAEVFSIEANAHLVAAAPELLDALELIADELDARAETAYWLSLRAIEAPEALRHCTIAQNYWNLTKPARQAIAKARGESL